MFDKKKIEEVVIRNKTLFNDILSSCNKENNYFARKGYSPDACLKLTLETSITVYSVALEKIEMLFINFDDKDAVEKREEFVEVLYSVIKKLQKEKVLRPYQSRIYNKTPYDWNFYELKGKKTTCKTTRRTTARKPTARKTTRRTAKRY